MLLKTCYKKSYLKFIANERGGEMMTVIEFLSYRIIGGNLEFKNVPKPLKTEVKTMLEEMGLGFLAE